MPRSIDRANPAEDQPQGIPNLRENLFHVYPDSQSRNRRSRMVPEIQSTAAQVVYGRPLSMQRATIGPDQTRPRRRKPSQCGNLSARSTWVKNGWAGAGTHTRGWAGNGDTF